jgi:colanic acid/amylovoran biosynthesis glycosyltransferase
MDTITVAHFINPFLPLTQNWIYHQLRFNTGCRNIVLCQTLENADQFPFENIFPAFPRNTLRARLCMYCARLRAQYCAGPYRTVIRREKPQVLHGHFSWESWRNIGLIQETRLPLITTFYGLDVNKLSRMRIWKKRYAALFAIGDLFSVEGAYMAEALAAIGCPREKIRIIPIGVDIETLSRHRVLKTGQNINIMFVGLRREKKGSVYAAEAFARVAVKNSLCQMHIVGTGPLAGRVKKMLHREGVLHRCVFHGALPYSSYCRLLGRMDIVMAPSVTAKNGDTEGGAPVVVIEAQAAGIPVVATFHCDIPNIVIDNETGLLCEERDAMGLASNLNELICNQELREKMGSAARVRAARWFSIQRQVEELNTLYRSMI